MRRLLDDAELIARLAFSLGLLVYAAMINFGYATAGVPVWVVSAISIAILPQRSVDSQR